MSEERCYRHNVLEGFQNGALLDLRVRFAMQLLQTSPLFSGLVAQTQNPDRLIELPGLVASLALSLADEVLTQADKNGWVESLPTDGEIGPALRDQAERTALFGILQQLAGARLAEVEQGVVATQGRAGGFFGGRN